jgi:hypothetical protein
MEGIDDLEMNEFVKKNPSYAEDFYSQMSKKYTLDQRYSLGISPEVMNSYKPDTENNENI